MGGTVNKAGKDVSKAIDDLLAPEPAKDRTTEVRSPGAV